MKLNLDGIPAPLVAAIEKRGFDELTEVQRAVVASLAERRDLRISSQTGSGKTVALGFVLAEQLCEELASGTGRQGPCVLVVVPTRELAAQVQKELEWLYAEVPGADVAVVTGGTSVGFERRRLRDRPAIVVGTPGRLLDHIRAGAIRCESVTQFVLDEADQMLDMGFRDELEGILDGVPAERRTHLVSATFPEGVQRLAERYQSDPQTIEGTTPGAAHADIEHVAWVIDWRDRYNALVNLLLLAGDDRTLVFVATRAYASKLAERLAKDGFAAMPLSGDLQQAQRTRTLDAFRQGTISTIVATDVAARGIDVPEVEIVVHADPPMDAQVYTHRSGRTGRAGRKGRSVSFATPRGKRRIGDLIADAGAEVSWAHAPDADEVRRALAGRARKELLACVEGEGAPTEAQLAFATRVLEGRDPVDVVARLFAQQEAQLPREPLEVGRPNAQDRRQERRPYDKRPYDKTRAPRDRQREGAEAGFVKFEVNWGSRGGATARRLLAMICRRGGVNGQQVGAIQIGHQATTFDVAESVAQDFERNSQRQDKRQPWMRIQRSQNGHAHVRDRGPRPRRDDRGHAPRRHAGRSEGGSREDGPRDNARRPGGRSSSYRRKAAHAKPSSSGGRTSRNWSA